MGETLPQQVYLYFGTGVFVLMAALLLLAFLRRSPIGSFLVATGVVLLTLVVPLRWSSVFVYIGSALGPLSGGFLALVLFSLLAFFRQTSVVRHQDEAVAVYLMSLAGAALYFSNMGWLGLPPVYAYGYDTIAGLGIAALVLLAGIVLSSVMTLVWICLGAAVWLFGLTGSNNLWDAFLDPVVWFTAISLACGHLFAGLGYPVTYRGLRMSSRPAPGRPAEN